MAIPSRCGVRTQSTVQPSQSHRKAHRFVPLESAVSEEKSISRRGAFASLLLPGIAAAAGCASTAGGPAAGARATARDNREFPERPGSTIMEADGTRTFRNHELRDQDGRVLRYQDDLIRGQVFAATFMYVHCTGICSDMTGKMTQAYDLLKPVMGNPVRFYTFSLAEDSPADLKEYMQARGLYGRPGWSFLTAPREVIKDIRWGFGFWDPDEELDNNLNGHTGMARFGNHRLDKWSSCPALANPVLTARSVLALFPPNQRPVIAGLERTDSPAARKIPNYTPAPPSTQFGS